VKEILQPHVIIPLAVIVGSCSMVAMTLIIVLRDKISGVFVSRSGVEIRTNDVPVWNKIEDKIERIDSNTCKSIRKATTGLMILDPEKYEMSTEAMLINEKANQPLIYAAYENHHTRELDSDADAYLADKAQDISLAVRIGKKYFPELTEEKSNAFACYWFKKVLLPNLRRACTEKVAYYISQIERSDVSNTIKNMLIVRRKKNEKYIQCIDEIATRLDIAEKSSIFYPAQTKETVVLR
jgi:hypothetical protein